jgi:hypothetical protein
VLHVQLQLVLVEHGNVEEPDYVPEGLVASASSGPRGGGCSAMQMVL